MDEHGVYTEEVPGQTIEISYGLAPDGQPIGPLVGARGYGGIPDWVREEATAYAERDKPRLLAMLRATRHGAFKADTGGDPIPAALGDSLWLGGEAMVAPGCVPPSGRTGCARAGEAADPDWCAL